MSGRKVTGLPLPDTPREAPPEIHSLVDAIENELGDSQTMGAVQALGRAFSYLTRYFAAVAGATADMIELGGGSAVAEDFESARMQLKDRLELLGEKATDPLSKLVRSVFYVGATRKTPTPRRPARLLDLGGIPIRGYLNLGEWIALDPAGKELSSDSKANRELLRYLPILKEWVTATATFFLDARQSGLRKDGDNAISFDLTLDGKTVAVGPLQLPPDLYSALAKHISEELADPPEVKPAPVSALETKEPESTPSEGAQAPVTASTTETTVPQESSDQPEVEGPPQAASAPADALSAPQAPPSAPEPIPSTPEPPQSTESTSPTEPTPSETPAVPESPPAVSPPVNEVDLSPTEPAEQAPATTTEPESAAPTAATQTAPEPPSTTPVDTVGQTQQLSPAALTGLMEKDAAEAQAETSTSVPEAVTDGSSRSDSEEVTHMPEPEPVASGSSGVEEAAPVEEAEESLPEPPKVAVPKSPPLPSRPDQDALADPVVAALHVGSSPSKPAAKAAEAPPALKVYPLPSGPPPEFFDEVDVEVDYPEVIRAAITDLNGAIESNDSILICGQMQRSFDILIQFFAGLAGSILMEIDSDALFDFEIEDGRFVELDIKTDLIVTALSALEEHWEGNDAANLLWSVFYDTLLPATDPNCAYLHTRLLGVEGLVPDPFIEFVELIERVPGQGQLKSQEHCRKVAHYYLPVLNFWLENAMPLFLECELDTVEEDDGKALSWAATLAGSMLDGTGSGFWLEIDPGRWNLPRPELAPVFVSGDAPEVLLPVFDELNLALEKGDFSAAGLQSRVALDFLVQYFAGCAASLWRQQGEMSEQALALFYPEASLSEKERLLLLSLGGVSTESEVGSSLSKLFTKGSLQYRALAQTDVPSGMAPVSEWASRRDQVDEDELVLYLPLLRSWIGAANPWFQAGEQLFEEPTAEGILEGVVAFAEDFLEMVDPEYIIQLPRECLELVAPLEEAKVEEEKEEVEPAKEETPFTGRLPQLPILTQGPPVLVGHVSRLLESVEDRRTSNAWLGSAFEYLIQYFAGLATTIQGAGEAPLPADLLKHYNPSASLRERELLLVAAVERLKSSASSSIQEQVRDIFFKSDGSYREHTKYLGALGAGSLDENEMLLSYWCRLRHQAGSLTTPDLHFGLRVLNSWLDAAKPYFASCEHYAEDPGADGQEEMVVELAEDYLDMVLPDYAIQIPARGYYDILYKEPDREAVEDMESYFPEDVRPNLLGPQEVVLGGVAGGESDELLGAAGDLGSEELFGGVADNYDSDDLFSGSAGATQKLNIDDMFLGATTTNEESPQEKPPEKKDTKAAGAEAPSAGAVMASAAADIKKRRKKKSKKQELGSAVLELYKKERLEKARRRAEARARKAESEPTQLNYNLQYRGLKNSKQLGGRGHFGLIELSNVGGGELKGTVEPAHPCVRVQPTRFEGNQVRVTYQVDPADMPSTGRVGLTINTQDQRVELRLDRLVPTSWFSERNLMEAIGLMVVPSCVYGFWLTILMGALIGPSVAKSIQMFGMNPELGKLPWVPHLQLWSFAVLAILPGASAIPGLIKSLFARLDYTVQEEIRWYLPALMMLPTLVFLAVMYGTSLWVFKVPPARLPPLGSRLVLTVLTFGLNLLATSLFSLQTTMWWEDRSDSMGAKRTFIGFWATTIILGVVLTFFMW